MEIVNKICIYIGYLLAFFVLFKTIYIGIGFLFKARKYDKTDIKKKYAVIIPARNEENVLPKLIESIKNQTYNQNLIDIFVIADNCNDNTAAIAKELGCHVYERNEPKKARKGYALEFLFKHIEEDFKISSFDGYLMFDADNILKEDFIERINEAFVENKNIVIGYRNTKNFDTNIISSSYGIHFFKSSMELHRPRNLLKFGTHLAGTGFVISSHLLLNGWKYFSLTEDAELTVALNDNGIKVGYCEAAIFYDEQPTKFSVAFRQRVRWTKGRLDVFFQNWKSLMKNIFKRKSFTSYDLFWYYFPYSLMSTIISIIYPLLTLIISIANNDFNLSALLKALGLYFGGQYVGNVLLGFLTIIREHKHIHCNFYKTILYVLCWPWFNMIGIVIVVIALFKKEVLWTPIIHNDNRGLNDIKKQSFIKKAKE